MVSIMRTGQGLPCAGHRQFQTVSASSTVVPPQDTAEPMDKVGGVFVETFKKEQKTQKREEDEGIGGKKWGNIMVRGAEGAPWQRMHALAGTAACRGPMQEHILSKEKVPHPTPKQLGYIKDPHQCIGKE